MTASTLQGRFRSRCLPGWSCRRGGGQLVLLLVGLLSCCYTAFVEAKASGKAAGKEKDGGGSRSETLLSSMLGPQPGAEAFARDYWQKMPSVIRRHNADFFSDLLRPDDVHAILTDGISLYNESSPVPEHGTDWKLVRRMKGADGEWWSSSPSAALTKAPAADVARAAFGKGFSVVINNMEQRWEPLAHVASAFENELGYRCGINMYFSPAQSQGFEVHMDWMDVFVLQVEGRKNWKLYDALVMQPRPDLKFKPSVSQVGEPFAEFVLEAGDLLYIPAGIIHEAHTLGLIDQSLHVSVGAESTVIGSWESLLLDLVAKATEDGGSPVLGDGMTCPKTKASLTKTLSTQVPQLAGSGLALRWGDLLTALIIHTAAQDVRLRSAVPLTLLTLSQQPKKNAVGGLKEVAKVLQSNSKLLKAALEDLRERNGTAPRHPPLPSGLPLFNRLEGFVLEGKHQQAQVAMGSRIQASRVMVTEGAVTLPDDLLREFKLVLKDFTCVLSERAPTILKNFRQAVRKDLDERQADRKQKLDRCRYKKAEYFVIGGEAQDQQSAY